MLLDLLVHRGSFADGIKAQLIEEGDFDTMMISGEHDMARKGAKSVIAHQLHYEEPMPLE